MKYFCKMSKTSSKKSNLTSSELGFISFVTTVFILFFILIHPYRNEVVVKKISNGKILGKDVKTGTYKIFFYDTTKADFNYVIEKDVLKYAVSLYQLKLYKKSNVIDFGEIELNSDSVYARIQRELFNQQLQQMSEKQK